MEEQLKDSGHFKKYWWVWVAAIFVTVGVAGITYLSLSQAKKGTEVVQTPTPTPTVTQEQQIEKEQKAIDDELTALEKDLTEINNAEASKDAVPAL